QSTGMVISARCNFEKIGNVDQSKDHSNDSWHHTAFSIMKETRFSRVEMTPGRFQVATAIRENILHPLRFAAIGQRDDEMLITPEDKNRRAVVLMGFASLVHNDSHSWKVFRQRTENRIGHMQIESC